MLEPNPLKIFYCYSQEDKKWRDKLARHLEPLRRSKKIITWYDREISPGKDYEEEILFHLNTSDIILALVSPAFIASNYCQQVEMHRALERHIIGDARIIPIILRNIMWKDTFLGRLQALPENGRPLESWRRRDDGFVNIVAGIQKVIEEIGDNRTVIDPELADEYSSKGTNLRQIGCHEEAVVAYKQSLRLNPDSFLTWYALLEALFYLKKYKEVLIVCERLSYSPDVRQEIFNIDNSWEAFNAADDFVGIYEHKIKALEALDLDEEAKAAIKDVEFIKKDVEWFRIEHLKKIGKRKK